MAGEISVAAVGLVGAAIGGGAALGASYLGFRSAREQARDARAHQLSDVRRAACVAFLSGADAYQDRLRELVAVLEASASPDSRRLAYEPYAAEWVAFSSTHAAVEICGPPDLALATRGLRQSLGSHSDIVEARYHGTRWPSGYEESLQRVIAARKEFVALAEASTN